MILFRYLSEVFWYNFLLLYVQKCADDLNNIVYISSGSAFLLYILMKSTFQGNLEEHLIVTPIVPHGNTSAHTMYQTTPPITSTQDFFAYMKNVVSCCYQLLLQNIYQTLDHLLEASVFMDDFASPKAQLHLDSVTSLLLQILTSFQANMIHITVSEQFFSAIFAHISSFLLNKILLQPQFCTDTFGIFLKQNLDALEAWSNTVGAVWLGNVQSSLLPIKQAASLLIMKDKTLLVEDKHRKNVCSSLSAMQIRQLLALYRPAEYGKRLPITVINAIKQLPVSKNVNSQILEDINAPVHIPIRILHYLDIADMFQTAIPKNLRLCVREYTKNS